jgi:hypothetical protein
MFNKRRRKLFARKRGPQEDPRVTRVATPKTRLKSLFALLHDVITSSDRTLLGMEDADQPLVRFDVAMLQRGINTLKAVRLLTEHGHWEFAASATRQLYELVINMEYLATEADREEATFLYAKFGLLQAVQAQHREVIYNQRTGRPIDEQRLAVLESMLEHTFPEFRDERRDGSVKWPRNWSGKSTRELAEVSTNRMRTSQYEQLFTIWSEQTHAAPGALFDSLAQRAGQNWIEQVIARDDVRIAEMVTVAISLFLELWHMLPNAPAIDGAQFIRWTDGLIREARKHGAALAEAAN